MSMSLSGIEKSKILGHRRQRSNSDPNATALLLAQIRRDEGIAKSFRGGKKTSGSMRTGSLGSNSRTSITPVEGKQSRLSALGRLFKPWKWKRKKKSDKFEQTSRVLERKISMRATKEELIKRGVLLADYETIKEETECHSKKSTPKIEYSVQANGSVATEASPKGINSINYQGSSLSGTLSESNLCNSPNVIVTCSSSDMSLLNQAIKEREEANKIPVVNTMLPSSQTDNLSIETEIVEEIPAKEPHLSAVPKKSALKKKGAVCNSNAKICFGSVSFVNSSPLTMPLTSINRPVTTLKIAKVPLAGSPPFISPENKENRPLPFMHIGSVLGVLNSSNSQLENLLFWRDYYGDDENCKLVAKIARKDYLAMKLAQRPERQDLINKNIIHLQSEQERQEVWEAVGNQLIRRLSLRPTAEELEQRNILKNQTPEEMKNEKEQKKIMLIRKLSFRPTIEELKERKIIRFSDYVEVTQAQDYDRRADKPWTRLTPRDKAAIRKELNEFKSVEMEVHAESKHFTRFHRP